MSNKKGLFSKNNIRLLSNPLDDDNPITVQVLGICSALAVTVKLEPAVTSYFEACGIAPSAVVMSIAVIFVLVFSSVIISLIRKLVPTRIRIIVQLLVIASLVAIVDEVLKAYLYDVSKQLSVFVGLIITNCIIMGRLEAFALANNAWESFLDALGNAFGYGWILIVVAFFRELLGSGTVWGYPVLDAIGLNSDIGYENNGMMVLPPMALITVGIIIWIQRMKNRKLIESK